MSVNRILTTMAAGGAMLAMLAVPAAGAQAPERSDDPQPSQQEQGTEPGGSPGAPAAERDQSPTTGPQRPRPGMGPGAGMGPRCQDMMAERQKMMTDMQAADKRLDDLVAKMNAASGTEQAAATAAVVTEMVAQRRKHREAMMGMQQRMMGHMMQHMQAGKGSMAGCPMMKERGGARP